MDSIPTKDDINVYDSLDERCAVKHFLGKDLKQAEELFRENFLYYWEDLMFMGPRAFCFYVPAGISYLLSEAADDDSDAVSRFCGLIEYHLRHNPERIVATKDLLLEAIATIVADFGRFGCNSDIYGDVKGRFLKLQKRLQASL